MKASLLFVLLSCIICTTFATFGYDRYDYIVLGGGTAGCVVAARLSEDPKVRVLLIERGQDVSNDPSVIVQNVNLVLPSMDISLEPVEDPPAYEPLLSSKFTRLYVPFALGGGPAVSGSFWGRGDPATYNLWAELTGDPALNYTNLLPYFKKTENVAVSDSASPDRGRTGPTQVTFLDPNDPDVAPYEASQRQVFNTTSGIDYATSAGIVGIWPMQRSLFRDPTKCNATSGPCKRQNSYETYIRPFLASRANLTIVTNANVLRLVMSPFNSKKVIGVVYELAGQENTVLAIKEVIVSMGAINSAKLLLLSGVNLPGIGKNIQDHFYTAMAYKLPSSVRNLTAPSAVKVSFFRSGFNGNYVDVEIAWGLVPANFILGPTATGTAFLAQVVQVHNTSYGGNMTLRSANFAERPNLTFNFNPALLNPMVWAVKKIRQWMSPLGVEVNPGFNTLPATATDEQIRAYLSGVGKTFFHIVGTCRMGDLTKDPTSVVDTHFKVHGYKKLRVVDNSVQPTIVPSHPTATAMALGELAAKYIIDDQVSNNFAADYDD